VQTKPESEENLRERLELLHLILYPMLTAGYPEDSLQLLQDGVEISQMLNDTKSSAIFNSRMGRYYSLKEGNPLLGIKYSEKSFQEAEKINDVELVARTGFDLFPSYAISGQVVKIVEMSKKIIVLLEKSKNERESFGTGWNIYSGVLSYCGWMMGWLGDFEKGIATLQKGHRFTAHKITEPFALAYIEFSYGWLFNIRGDGTNAIEHLRKAIIQLEDQKSYSILGIAWNQMGWAHYLIGELETARRNIEKALSIQQDAGMQFWMSLPFLLLSMIHSDSGKDQKALSCIEEAINLSQNNLEKGILGYSKIWHGRIMGKVDLSQWGRAQEAISEGIGILEELQLKPWSTQGYLFLGELYVAIGHKEKAKENLEKAQNDFQKMGMDYWLNRTQKILNR
jgi:tetratricopeptide (TPR) repeat protein